MNVQQQHRASKDQISKMQLDPSKTLVEAPEYNGNLMSLSAIAHDI